MSSFALLIAAPFSYVLLILLLTAVYRSFAEEEMAKRFAPRSISIQVDIKNDEIKDSRVLAALNDKVAAFVRTQGHPVAHGNKLCDKSRELLRRVHQWMKSLGELLSGDLPAFNNALTLTEAATGVGRKGIDGLIKDPNKYLKMGLKIGPDPAASRGKRAIVIGVITENGILDGSFKVWTNAGNVEDGDYHKTMNAALFEQYLATICPLLVAAAGGRKPILVLDNAPYHNAVSEKLPCTSSKKAEIIDFLMKKGVSCSQKDKKKDLLYLLNNVFAAHGGRIALKSFTADVIAEDKGVTLVRLPPYHCILNPIEHFWGYLKGKLTKGTMGKEKLDELRTRALDIIAQMPAEKQSNFYGNAVRMEQEFIQKEGIVSVSCPPMIITVDPDDDDEEVAVESSGGSSSEDETLSVDEEEAEAVAAVGRDSKFKKFMRNRRRA